MYPQSGDGDNKGLPEWPGRRKELMYIKQWGTWVAQWVKHPTLDFGSAHDLMVHGFDPTWSLGSMLLAKGFSLSPSLSAPPLLSSACTH